jgi:hypothetical protein
MGLDVAAVRQPCVNPGRETFHIGFGGRMRHRSNSVSLTRPAPQSEKRGFADAATRVSLLGVNALCLADRRQLAQHIPVSACGGQRGFPSSPKTFLRILSALC